MQNVITLHLRGAVPRNQRIGKQRHRAAAVVGDVVFDGEQIMLVNGDGAPEDEALAVVVSQRHRPAHTERARSFLLPHRVGTGYGGIAAGRGHPAEFGIKGVRRARRREQHDRRRVRIGFFAILRERQIVDAAAFEIDAAAKPRRLDRNARRGCDHSFTRGGLRLGGRCAGFWRSRYFRCRRLSGVRSWRGRLRARLWRARLRLRLLFELRFLALPFHLRIADEILPADNHDDRQHHGQNGVLVLSHSMLVLTGPVLRPIPGLPPQRLDRPALCGGWAPAAPVPAPLWDAPFLPAPALPDSWTRRSAPPSSFVMVSKASLSAVRRPIST